MLHFCGLQRFVSNRKAEVREAKSGINLFSLLRRHLALSNNSHSTHNVSTGCVFPTELIFHILYDTDPRDILRWRTVSKWFCTITRDPFFWKVLYANTPFTRPRDPLPSQSVASLERALVQSARLAQSWATRPLSQLSRVEIQFSGRLTSNARGLVDGRWLITCQSNRRFVLYDTIVNATMHPPRILWEQEEIAQWDMCAVVHGGQWIIYVLFSVKDFLQLKLVELRLDDSGVLCDAAALDVPQIQPHLWYYPSVMGRSPFLFIQPLELVFDIRTRLFFEYPEFHIATDEIRHKFPPNWDPPPLWDTTFIDTHIFHHCRRVPYGSTDDVTLIQAFTIPDDPLPTEDKKNTLRLSHEGICLYYDPFVLIRGATVDPITGSTSVRFLSRGGFAYHPRCIDMTLPKASSVDVMPISMRSQPVFTRANEPLLETSSLRNLWTSERSGHARGFFTLPYDTITLPVAAIAKFTIDASRDRCTVSMGGVCSVPPGWVHSSISMRGVRSVPTGWVHSYPPAYSGFDGIRGRLYYIWEDEETKGTLIVLEVE